MKTIVLCMLLTGLTVSGNAQDKSCNCKKKTAHHYVSHSKTALNNKKRPAYLAAVNPEDAAIACYKQSEVAVKDCPPWFDNNNGCVFDNNGNVKYIIERTYSGYYPDVTESVTPGYRELSVTSSAFKNFGVMPAKYTCEGQQASPPLSIGNIPADSKSLAVIMYDPDANANGSLTYWQIWDIDTTGNIPENFVNDHEALNAAHEYGYQGVCPVSGTHYYHFMVYALDTKLLGGRHTSRATLENAMKGHILAKGELIGAYNKHLD